MTALVHRSTVGGGDHAPARARVDRMDELAELLHLQAGVVSRAQALDAGLAEHDVRRLLRRRSWATVHPGVYVDHTGSLTWQQRTWAAVLALHPAALSHRSAVAAAAGKEHDGPLHVMVDRSRSIRVPAGVVRHRVADFAGQVQTNTSPPRQRVEDALLDVAASARDELDAIAVLGEAVGGRRTTAARLRTALAARRRMARRALLAGVLDDLADGACSSLEHGYLHRVERAHDLPTAQRQVRASARGTVYRDVDYAPWRLLVELDGRLFHTRVRTGRATSTATSRRRSGGRTPCGSGGGRCSAPPARRRPRSACSPSSAAGPGE